LAASISGELPWEWSSDNSPDLFPRFALIVALERDDPVQRERARRVADEQRQQTRKMEEVSGDENVARLAAQAIANPLGWVFGLKVARRRERCEGVAGAPECLSRLTGPKLAAVPHHSWTRAARRGFGRETNDVSTTLFRKRAPRIDLWSNRVAVVDEIKSHV